GHGPRPSLPIRPARAAPARSRLWLPRRPAGRLRQVGVDIEVLTKVTDEVVDAFRTLLPQLSSSAQPLDSASLSALAESEATTVLLARVDGQIVGSLTLVLFTIPTGTRAWIEDVVTDEAARGQGVGMALTLAALDLARAGGARTVDLTT